jgi:aspartyl-tRNA(Asn)/glutamyl-tRNA(Gln) amidotransferase subunit B
VQETRLWDSDRGETTSMRSKEDAHDYRYFPEPDLSPLDVDAAWIAEVRAALPELPEARKQRFMAVHGLGDYDADNLVRLIGGGADYFEALVAAGATPKAASNWIQGELRRRLKDLNREHMDAIPVKAEALAELLILADRNVISSSVAKDVFEKMCATGDRAQAIVDREGLAQNADAGAIADLVAAVLAENPDPVAQFKAGRTNIMGFLVGQVIKRSQGKANPKVVQEAVRKALEG